MGRDLLAFFDGVNADPLALAASAHRGWRQGFLRLATSRNARACRTKPGRPSIFFRPRFTLPSSLPVPVLGAINGAAYARAAASCVVAATSSMPPRPRVSP